MISFAGNTTGDLPGVGYTLREFYSSGPKHSAPVKRAITLPQHITYMGWDSSSHTLRCGCVVTSKSHDSFNYTTEVLSSRCDSCSQNEKERRAAYQANDTKLKELFQTMQETEFSAMPLTEAVKIYRKGTGIGNSDNWIKRDIISTPAFGAIKQKNRWFVNRNAFNAMDWELRRLA